MNRSEIGFALRAYKEGQRKKKKDKSEEAKEWYDQNKMIKTGIKVELPKTCTPAGSRVIYSRQKRGTPVKKISFQEDEDKPCRMICICPHCGNEIVVNLELSLHEIYQNYQNLGDYRNYDEIVYNIFKPKERRKFFNEFNYCNKCKNNFFITIEKIGEALKKFYGSIIKSNPWGNDESYDEF